MVSLFTASLIIAFMIASWGEPYAARGLTRPIDNSAKYNIESCLDKGSQAGFNACGLEFGGEVSDRFNIVMLILTILSVGVIVFPATQVEDK